MTAPTPPPLRVFTLIGDSNVRSHMNETNCQDRPLMSAAQVLICTNSGVFPQTLRSIRGESNVCVLSCITNFLCDSPSTSTSVTHRVTPVLDDFFALVLESCRSFPERQYLVCPPMYRLFPLWLRDNLPEILTEFSSGFAKAAVQAANLHAMPGFPTPAFEPDGIHLTPFAGSKFVLHLFARSKMILDNLTARVEDRTSTVSEEARAYGDRLIAVEQDHRRLVDAFNLKTAIDSELACFRANERNEDSFIISGLGRIRDGLTGRQWQEAAQREVKRALSLFISTPVAIVVVHNVTGRSPGSVPTFSVRLKSVDDARMIRAKFGSFFSRGTDSRPAELKDINIKNVLTKDTRVRISIMKLLGKRYKDTNPGSSFQVIGFEPRPILKLTPPQDASDRRIKSFNFIEAVQKLPVSFSQDDWKSLYKQVGGKYRGKLKSLFVVLDDDKVKDFAGRSGKRGRSPGRDTESPPRQRRNDTETE